MSRWTSSVIGLLLLLQTVYSQTEQSEVSVNTNATGEVVRLSEHPPTPRLHLATRDWDLKRAYSDAFQILSSNNKCSHFYGGPRVATTVLNSVFAVIKSEPLIPEISFQMSGKRTLVRVHATNFHYRVFDRISVNSNGAFYQRRESSLQTSPANVGTFRPGTRRARLLILLHELGHLIQNEKGTWLLADDGYDGTQSKANTFIVQQMCRIEIEHLK